MANPSIENGQHFIPSRARDGTISALPLHAGINVDSIHWLVNSYAIALKMLNKIDKQSH
jgi:hypothetical protein